MPWPLSQDYNEAIQSPAQCFADPELRGGEAETNALGLPVPRSGNFADVYAVVSGSRKWAVKCFTRQIPGLQERYQQISLHLAQVKLPFMVDFTFQEKGIRVRGQWYPLLKMQWVEGLTLNQFVKSHLDKPQVLELLCQLWIKLSGRLREANIAHCDLQHGNVLLVPASRAGALQIKLVDYDGICVPALTLLKSIDVGHPAYQHPQRQREGIYNLEVDRFSHLVIYTALRALMAGGQELWDRHDDGDNLLFKPADYAAPTKSRLLYQMLKSSSPELAKLVGGITKACAGPLEKTPLLEQLAAAASGGTPAVPASPRTNGNKPPVLPRQGILVPSKARADSPGFLDLPIIRKPHVRRDKWRAVIIVTVFVTTCLLAAGGYLLLRNEWEKPPQENRVVQKKTTSTKELENHVPKGGDGESNAKQPRVVQKPSAEVSPALPSPLLLDKRNLPSLAKNEQFEYAKPPIRGKVTSLDAATRRITLQLKKSERELVLVKMNKDFEDFIAADYIKVRIQELPTQHDDKGKPRKYNDTELKYFKGPDPDLPGFTADFEQVQVGQEVDVYLPKQASAKAKNNGDNAGSTMRTAVMLLIKSKE